MTLLAPAAAEAGCDNHAPTTGQAVLCSADAPTPDPAAVVSAAGEADVAVAVETGAALDVAGSPAISLGAGGSVANRSGGSITGGSAGIVSAGPTTIINDGSIIGTAGTGVAFSGAFDDVLVNRGNIRGAGLAVAFGDGNDHLQMDGGTIDGSVDQGTGADTAEITGGTITGNLQQGAGSDDFVMAGGQLGSLNQGDNIDTFSMTDGWIVGGFDDGDLATMSGGRIGRVNMKLDDNRFDMSGGTIDGNLVTGFGNDTIVLSDGFIGGNISVSGGEDSVTVTGGAVGGEVRMSAGTDVFNWDGGGIIYGAIDLGAGDDRVTLGNLNGGHLGATPLLTGGPGVDGLRFDNVSTTGVARFQSWEQVTAGNDTELTFDGDLALGDADSGTGSLTVDASSTLFAGNGANASITAFDAAQLANVSNAGRIDLSNGAASATDTFTIAGNYVGDGGAIFLQTQLGDDSSPSDKLVIAGGAASGSTGLGIVNLGGTGSMTLGDGIMVVQASNGATTAAGAFGLLGPVAAGAFEYFLLKGGVSAGSGDNWYLRSTLVTPPPTPDEPAPVPPEPAPAPSPLTLPPTPPAPAPPEPPVPPPPPLQPPPAPTPDNPDPSAPPPAEPAPVEPPAPPPPLPEPPTDPAPVPAPATPSSPPTPGATASTAAVVPLYRIETPVYAAVPVAARELALTTLGTFHERQGEQALLQGDGAVPAAWGRVVGQRSERSWSGTVAPSFDGSLWAVQVGSDVYAHVSDDGRRDRFGLFAGRARIDGDVRGFALGWNNLTVGTLELDSTHLGAYWSRVGPSGGYLDAVLMGSRFDGESHSARMVGIDIEGDDLTASLEIGYPLAWRDDSRWSLEPQLQLIGQRVSVDRRQDRFAAVSFDSDTALTGRIGLRLLRDRPTAHSGWQPYLKLNLWNGFGGADRIRLDADVVETRHGSSALEFGGGVVVRFNEHFSSHLTADYTTDLGDDDRETIEANLGVRVTW
ncbi:MAG: autotransporter domain-containing protein [Lysobacter sp.]